MKGVAFNKQEASGKEQLFWSAANTIHKALHGRHPIYAVVCELIEPKVCDEISRSWKKIETSGFHHSKLHPKESSSS